MDPLHMKTGANLRFDLAQTEDEFYAAHSCEWLHFLWSVTVALWRPKAQRHYRSEVMARPHGQ